MCGLGWRYALGEVAERSKATVLKTVVLETVPWVRIPPSPQIRNSDFQSPAWHD